MYTHYMVTKEGLEFSFYQTPNDVDDVLNSNKDFNYEDNWVIDASGNENLLSKYATFGEDNSFVLIPKSSVQYLYVVHKDNQSECLIKMN